MATNIEEIFRSFVVKKMKEIEDEKQQSGKVINGANGEIKPVVEVKAPEDVADTTVVVQEEPIVKNAYLVIPVFQEEHLNDNPANKENLTAESVATAQIKSPALSDKEDSITPSRRKSKKHKHKHHHKHKSKKKKKKRRKKDEKRDHSRSRSGSYSSLKAQSGLQLQSPSESPVNNEYSSGKNKNIFLLTKSSRTQANKNAFDEVADTDIAATVGVGKECSVAEKKPSLQENCSKSLPVKENSVVAINVGKECTTVGNVPGLLAATLVDEQNQESRLFHHGGLDNVQSKSTQTVEEKSKNDRTETRKPKRSRSRSHSKSVKHRKSQLHSHSEHSPVRKSCASSSSRHQTSQSSCSRKGLSPVRLRSKSTSREQKKHTESSPKSKRKQSRSHSIAKTEQKSKSKSRSPSRLHRRSRSPSITRTKWQSKSRPCSRSSSRSKHRSRSPSGSPVRSKSRAKRLHSPRPRSRSNDRRCHQSSSRLYQSRLVRTRRSPDWRRRSRSPVRRQSASRTPERLTDLDKAQLLEIAKANAAATCAKAGMPLPANLKPAVPLVKHVITKKIGCSSIQELTEKCKKIVESNDGELGSEPHASEEDESFINQPIKVNELKSISFSLNNAAVKPAPKTQVALTKEFPVSSGTQHRKKEVLKVYGEWAPVEKDSEETTDDVFTDLCTQAVDISVTMSERATAQKRLVENPYDVEAMSMILRAQEQIDVWAQSNSLPGQFTGSTGAQVLTYEELSNSGPQAWIRKFMFSDVSSSQTSDAVIQRESNWSPSQNWYKSRTKPWATLAGVCIILCMVASFFCEVLGKTGEEGNGSLVAEGEKTQKKSANFPIVKDLSGKHPVSALMEICNKRKWPPPDFLMVHDSGPDHRKHFLFKVMINGTEYKPSFPSPNKKHAKASAATIALQTMGLVPKDGAISAGSFKSASDDAM
ncbi:protein SON isoform X2 [Scyliorhinus canicula]|uniref:protein SON isoform X2 n=1 Tax=Scyliorhinus canicula TaxID=7830 RepID=UPI0018F50DA7|nr:protein SON isoform X2 [Scyliorhinus canicula]